MSLRHVVAGALVVLVASTVGFAPTTTAAAEAEPRQVARVTQAEGHHIRNMSSHLCLAARQGPTETSAHPDSL